MEKKPGMNENKPTIRRPILVHGGMIERGEQKGRALGFPTANLTFKGLEISGTYAGRVIIGGGIFKAAIYANPKRNLLEAHLLDINQDLYGKRMVVQLFEKISDEHDFTDRESLKTFISESVGKVRDYFKI